MRLYYKQVLKSFFHTHLEAAYKKTGMTQADMAFLLAMDLRSFADLLNGKSCCSALTFIRFLLYFCPDRAAFLDELQAAFEAEAPIGRSISDSVGVVCSHCGTKMENPYVRVCYHCGCQLFWKSHDETA